MVTFQNMFFGDGQMVNFQNMSGEPVFSKEHARRTSKICVPSQKAHFWKNKTKKYVIYKH
jgi:hypothetical protein